jgi:hypothetical protein
LKLHTTYIFERTARDLSQFLLDEESKKSTEQEKTAAASAGVQGNTKTKQQTPNNS